MNQFTVSEHLTQSYADYYAEGESEWRRLGARSKADNIVRLCQKLPHASIVDIGAGEGSVVARLSELGFGEELYALEISQSGVDVTNARKVPRLRECRLFDGYQVPYEDECFELAVLSHVVEHVEYPRRLIHEAARVAKYVFIEVPLEDNVRLARDFVLGKVGHINFYTDRSIRRLVQSCGLKVIDQVVLNATKETYLYQSGRKGLLKYALKGTLLSMLPSIATQAFTYGSALVCERQAGKQ